MFAFSYYRVIVVVLLYALRYQCSIYCTVTLTAMRTMTEVVPADERAASCCVTSNYTYINLTSLSKQYNHFYRIRHLQLTNTATTLYIYVCMW
jgi:hypothetical protein